MFRDDGCQFMFDEELLEEERNKLSAASEAIKTRYKKIKQEPTSVVVEKESIYVGSPDSEPGYAEFSMWKKTHVSEKPGILAPGIRASCKK